MISKIQTFSPLDLVFAWLEGRFRVLISLENCSPQNALLLQQKHAIVPIQQNMLLFSRNLPSSIGFLIGLTRE